MIFLAGTALVAVGLAAMAATPGRNYFRGRHISRPLARRVGHRRAQSVRTFLILGTLVAAITTDIVWLTFVAAQVVWVIDDAFFSDDDDHKRRYEWARVRLRMPKPVKLRPVERVPQPA